MMLQQESSFTQKPTGIDVRPNLADDKFLQPTEQKRLREMQEYNRLHNRAISRLKWLGEMERRVFGNAGLFWRELLREDPHVKDGTTFNERLHAWGWCSQVVDEDLGDWDFNSVAVSMVQQDPTSARILKVTLE